MNLVKDVRLMNVCPRIPEYCHELLGRLWKTTNQGAEWLLASFPNLYERSLKELRGRFSKTELELLLDLADALVQMPEMAGHLLIFTLRDHMMLPSIKHNYPGVDTIALIDKLVALDVQQRAILEIWAGAYKYTPGDISRGDYISELLL